MTTNDLIYNILTLANDNIKDGTLDIHTISAESLGVSEFQWYGAIKKINAMHYMEGLDVYMSADGEVSCTIGAYICVTDEGNEFLNNNSQLKKCADMVDMILNSVVKGGTLIDTLKKLF